MTVKTWVMFVGVFVCLASTSSLLNVVSHLAAGVSRHLRIHAFLLGSEMIPVGLFGSRSGVRHAVPTFWLRGC